MIVFSLPLLQLTHLMVPYSSITFPNICYKTRNHLMYTNEVKMTSVLRSLARELISHLDLNFQGNPSEVSFRLLPILEIPVGSRKSRSCDADFTYVDKPSGFMGIFILHENVHKTRVVALSAKELVGTMSKNNLRGIILGIRPMWRINSLILHPVLVYAVIVVSNEFSCIGEHVVTMINEERW